MKTAYFFPLVCLLALQSLSFSAVAEEKQMTDPVTVTTAYAAKRNIPALIEVVGTIQAVERAAIAAKVTGTITDVPVVLGSRVQKGDLLVKISAEEITAQLRRSEAQLKQAERNLDREQNLLKKHATTAETVKSMQDMYNVARAGYQEVQTMLGYTTISAPFDGVVTRKSAHPGDLATPGATLLHIENDQNLQVVTAVPESLVLSIKPGAKLQLTVPSAGILTEGVVAEVAPSADPASRTAPVTIDLKPNSNLRTGQFARVMLPGKERQSLFIPQSAVVPKGQLDRVFVVENSSARLRLVRTGMHHDGMVEILSGLEPEEQVITSNNTLLVNGQPLQIRP
jgi:RND family efflux transporter MFP subunit